MIKPFEIIKSQTPTFIYNNIVNEHPQLIALVLSYIDSKKAALILALLPLSIQSIVARRISKIKTIQPSILRDIERIFERNIANENGIPINGMEHLIKILSNDRHLERSVLEAIEEDDPEQAENIKINMFTFEDIILLSDKQINKIIKNTKFKHLAIALKSVDVEIVNKFAKLLNKPSKLYTAMDKLGPIRLEKVDKMQQQIIKHLHKTKKELNKLITE